LLGKWHNETPRDPSGYGVRYLPESAYTAWRAAQGLAPQPHANGWFGEIDPHITKEQHRLAWESRAVSDCIESFAGSEAPWMIRWDPSEPHLPNVVPAEIAQMYPPETIPPWPSFHDTLGGKPFIQSQQRRTWGVDGWTWKEWSQVVSRYLAEITLMDEQIGRVLATLDRLGLRERTLVIYTTDHGDFCGGHGQMDKHFNMYDDVVRVPLIMRWPGEIPAGARRDDFVSHEIDLARTVVTLARSACPSSFLGVDLVPVAKGLRGTGRQDIFTQYQGTQFGLYSQRMLRDSRWKYVWNLTDVDELYDLQSDPGELTNLAAREEFSPELQRLRRRLIVWLESIRDPILNEFTRVQLTRANVKL
jgi:arylsulfatase A-like enzyme